MSFDPTLLPWLLPAPDDFRERCRALAPGSQGLGSVVQSLANHSLSPAQANTLSKAIHRLCHASSDLSPLAPFKLSILPGATYDFIAAGLPAAAARHGVALEVALAPLGQIEQEVLNPASSLRLSRPDGVLLGIDHRWLGLDVAELDGNAEARVIEAVDRVAQLAEGIADLGAAPLLPTIPTPGDALFGSYDRRAAGTVRAMVEHFNSRLPEVCARTGGAILDVAAICETVGSSRWFDPVAYNLYKLPFASDAVPLFCDMAARVLGALRGKARKCLVLDLDNTCWGGVIGDDGLEGIRIGGGAEGEAFASVQRMALSLKQRGVILAVCSKNDDANARIPFQQHPDMLLKESDIAVFQANWTDKASNLEAIAATLEIGLDALVLLDDNGAERAQVRAALPMVACPELPNDPAYYPAYLLGAGYFESVSFSSEDRLRSQSYAANAQRAEVKSRSRNLDDYLSSLEMRIGFSPFDAVNRARIAQLVNKTNQFNLTTRRYTEAQIAALEGGADLTLQVRLSDRYGDFGMIGLIIARRTEDDVFDIDTWLMSCRVLGRKVEEGMLAELVNRARDAGATRLIGHYNRTAKNAMVADHYDKLGFTRCVDEAPPLQSYWLDLDGYRPSVLPFSVLASE